MWPRYVPQAMSPHSDVDCGAAQSCQPSSIRTCTSLASDSRSLRLVDSHVLTTLFLNRICYAWFLNAAVYSCRQCFSELNVLLRHNSLQLRDVPLAGYTSLTRCPKAAAFDKLLSAEHLQPNQLHQRCPPHVQAISVMLRRYFGGHDEASLCRYTVPTQDWMMQWCNKWGFSGRQISLWTVNA